MLTSCSLPSLIWIKLGILPRKSSSVCIFTAALVVRNGAHGKSDSDKSIVVESRAYAVLARWRPKGSLVYSLRAQTRFDVPQALAKRQLRKRHAQKLILAGEALDLAVAAVPSNAALEYHRRQMPHKLREDQFSRMHRSSPRAVIPGPTMPAFGLEIVNTPESTFSAVLSSSYACLNHQRWDRPDTHPYRVKADRKGSVDPPYR